MTQVETESRAPEESAQPSGDDRLVPLGDLLEKAERKGCLDEAIKFINGWKPSAGESAERQNTTADADDKQLRIAQCMAGERVTASHWFSGWAVVIRNVLPMVRAMKSFADEDQRETKYDDQDGFAINGMANFIEKELEALAGHYDRAGDASNPRIIASNGYVWRLEAEAVLVEKPADAKGGAS